MQLAFHETKFNVVNHNNQIWLTAVEIARALQYKTENSVSRIYARNSDEFTSGMSEEVKLTLSGNLTKSVRIFSLRGAHLIAMFARTPIAKEFRRWVLDVLDREVGTPEIIPVKPVVKTRREVIYYENDVPVARLPLSDSQIMMDPDSCLERVMRSGFVVIPCDEMGKMTLDELWVMAEETKKLRDRVQKNFQELAEKYDF